MYLDNLFSILKIPLFGLAFILIGVVAINSPEYYMTGYRYIKDDKRKLRTAIICFKVVGYVFVVVGSLIELMTLIKLIRLM